MQKRGVRLVRLGAYGRVPGLALTPLFLQGLDALVISKRVASGL